MRRCMRLGIVSMIFYWGCPHHGFSELHQLDTFYNALNSNDQDSLNSAAGGNFLDKMPRECLKIIESKLRVRLSRNKAVVAKMSTSSSTKQVLLDVAESKGHASTFGSGTLPGNTITNPKEDLKGITTRSGVTIQGPKAINHDAEDCNPEPTVALLVTPSISFLALEDDPTSSEVDPTYQDPEGDILLLEAILNTVESSVNEPPEVELKELPPHLEYAFLEGDDKLPVIIAKDLKDEEKAALLKVLKSHKRAIAWKLSDIKGVSPEFCTHKILMERGNTNHLCKARDRPWVSPIQLTQKIKKKTNFHMPIRKLLPMCNACWAMHCSPNAPGTFQRCMMAIFHDMIEKTMEVFMDDFSVFGDSFSTCLTHLEKMLKRCEDTNLSLNWEKSHFMVKEGIVLGHKISKSGLEVDRAKVEVIAKLPHPTSVKGVRSFLGHAGFYRRFIQDFSKIARPMTHLLEKETPFVFSEECIDSFNTLKRKLTEAPILIAPDWDLPFELMCDASDFAIGAVLGQRKNKHFQPIHYASKTMNEAQTHYTTTEKELLAVVYAFEKFRSYLVMSKSIVYTDHSAIKYLFAKKDAKARLMRICADQVIRRCVSGQELLTFSKLATVDPQGDTTDFPDCEDSRARSIHMSFTSSSSFWESSIQI
ncbi:reverse transcriptase domain-containing protein [Tanacetum coccineum]